MNEASRQDILERLAGAVARETLVKDAAALSEYSRPGFPGNIPACAVKPLDADGVRSVVDVAAGSGLNLIPVSSGPPHVKGGSAPAPDALTVDLSGMNRILHFDRRNRVAVIEPGVTFAALETRAAEEGLRPMAPLLPRAGKSVLGSYLEREPVTIPKYHWDMTDPLLCVEVVFGTGDVFRTGSAAGPGSLEDQWAAGNAQKNPMGPAATDLVKLVQGAQGTMGIVTWGSVRLELQPSVQRFRLLTAGSVEPLMGFARELARRKLGDELLVLDSTNVSAIADRHRQDADRFTLIYCVSGLPGYLPEDKVAYQERDIAGIAGRLGLKPRDTDGARELGGILSHPCPDPHWKSKPEGACQDIFFLTTMDRAGDFVDAMDRVAASRGIDPEAVGTYIQPIMQGRACHAEFNLYFDPSDASASENAAGAAREAVSSMAAMGAFFSRPYEPWVDEAYARCADTVDALNRLKRVFDPSDIMNRGKLCFGGGGPGGAR